MKGTSESGSQGESHRRIIRSILPVQELDDLRNPGTFIGRNHQGYYIRVWDDPAKRHFFWYLAGGGLPIRPFLNRPLTVLLSMDIQNDDTKRVCKG